MRNLENFRQAVESPKIWIRWPTFVQKKLSFSWNIMYRGFICLTFNSLVTKFLIKFLKSEVIFPNTTPLYNSFSSKCKYSDFRLFPWKLTKFYTSFFKPPVSSYLNIASNIALSNINLPRVNNFDIKQKMEWVW